MMRRSFISGEGGDLNGDYPHRTVEHTLDRSGYRTYPAAADLSRRSTSLAPRCLCRRAEPGFLPTGLVGYRPAVPGTKLVPGQSGVGGRARRVAAGAGGVADVQ